ncbi:UDP-2,3-diacylglucosamine diphosphatase LpxI [uncultured Tateyamaria sp.]|uniref:LpxI family protein n=1 Tax=Tateyamaria sp. 1078 TaxID=3417464 RepID=UPI00262B5BBE|nr:UDP-2,3-diacylglucosamine diphosphatase LpxI [uncultured Tateyamaria sp.]
MSLALITGRGALPAAVAAAQDTRPLICTLDGHLPDGLTPDLSFRIEKLGGLLRELGKRGVTEVCFCGAIDRPNISLTRLDARTVPLLPALSKAVGGGEDSALRTVLGIFQDKGFAVRGAHDLAPGLLPPSGVLTLAQPLETTERDLSIAEGVHREQGRKDEGQSCVIRDGVVIATEDRRGTDAMLADLVSGPAAPPQPLGDDDPFGMTLDMVGGMLDGAADWLSGPVAEARAKGHGGVFFKAPKPGQDMRVDLPTIGPGTAERAIAAKLDGIVLAKGGVMVLDRDRVIDMLDDKGLFLWVR